MGKLDKGTRILAKLAEVAHWIGAVSMVVALVLTLCMGLGAVSGVTPEDAGASLTAYGFEVVIVNGDGQVEMAALRCFCVGGAVILSLMAMVFRNIYLILKRSEHETPFQKDNVRMVREIGIFLIAVPAMGLVMNVVTGLVAGPELREISVRLDSFMVGLVVLCLSRFFARGVELEADAEGLV